MWRSSLWSISWLRHQMFYPHVTISATIFSLSYFFYVAQRILGYVRPRRIVAVHPPQRERTEGASGGAFRLRRPSRGVVTLLALKCSSEECRPWTETLKCCSLLNLWQNVSCQKSLFNFRFILQLPHRWETFITHRATTCPEDASSSSLPMLRSQN